MMAKQDSNNVKLGLFVLTGLVVMIVSFFMISKNTSVFGSKFELKARFTNLNGLMEGNNVLFSGIQAGTVKEISMVNDTTIEVVMRIDSKIAGYIHANAIAAIGTDGLMGNKVVNIEPIAGAGIAVKTGESLTAQKLMNTDEMLLKLSKTNDNIAILSESLKNTALGLDTSAVFTLLNDKEIGTSLKSSLQNINYATNHINTMALGINGIVSGIRQGKGAAGMLLSDADVARDLKTSMANLKSATEKVNIMTAHLNTITGNIDHDLSDGKGPLHAVLRDSMMTKKINVSLDHVKSGTEGLDEIVEALKHNFLVRGYFRKKEKAEQKQLKATN